MTGRAIKVDLLDWLAQNESFAFMQNIITSNRPYIINCYDILGKSNDFIKHCVIVAFIQFHFTEHLDCNEYQNDDFTIVKLVMYTIMAVFIRWGLKIYSILLY